MATIRDLGIPVKRAEVGEGDLLLEILTQYNGTVNAVAPGARKLLSRKRGNVELGVISKFSFAEGKSRLIVVEAEAESLMESLRGTTVGVDFLMDLLKVSRVLFADGDREAFALLAQTLHTADRICAKLEERPAEPQLNRGEGGCNEKNEKQQEILRILREWFYYQALRWSGLVEPSAVLENEREPSFKTDLLKLKKTSVFQSVTRLTAPVLGDILGDYYGSNREK